MKHSILFTGHMIDAEYRPEPRFPANKENAVKQELRKQLLKEKVSAKKEICGIASGASGGDILFHELCIELDIPAEMYLALPIDEFKKKSISPAGKDWNIRFEKLEEKLPVHILPGTSSNDNVWERTNLWMLNKAIEKGGENMTLIALWDGKGGDGSGGTEHMINIAKQEGAGVNIIDINKIQDI